MPEFVYDVTIRHSNGLKGTAGLTDTANVVNEEIGEIRKRSRKQTRHKVVRTKGELAQRLEKVRRMDKHKKKS